MKILVAIAILVSLQFVGFSANAEPGVELLGATGVVSRTVFGASSPTPGWCSWEHLAGAGTTFSATELDGTGNTCGSWPWLVRCDTDGIAFTGSWPQFVVGAYQAAYQVAITCTIDLTESKRLNATRAVVGVLDTNIHSLSITYPDSSVVEILAADGGVDSSSIVLEASVYTVKFIVEAQQNVGVTEFLDPYEGLLELEWANPSPLALESRKWGEVKALYR